MLTRLIATAAAVLLLATAAQAQSVKTFPQTKPGVYVKPKPIFVPPVHKVPVYKPPVFYPPVYRPPVYLPTFPIDRPPYFPVYPGYPWYGW